jgi:hypothetical protein
MSPLLTTTPDYCAALRARDAFYAEHGSLELWDRTTFLAYLPCEIAFLRAQSEMVSGWQIEICLEAEGGDPPAVMAHLDDWAAKLEQVLEEAEALIAQGRDCDVLALFATCRASAEAAALEQLAGQATRPAVAV